LTFEAFDAISFETCPQLLVNTANVSMRRRSVRARQAKGQLSTAAQRAGTSQREQRRALFEKPQ
jgi:hypothetical protein